jgi:glycosyltransferase involved in cell wall biosynthesis
VTTEVNVGVRAVGRRAGADEKQLKDLLVTSHTPVLRSGQAVRTYGVARALAAHGGLTLLYVRFGAPEPDGAFRAIPGVELCEVVPSRGARRLLAYGAARLGGVPEGFARGASSELAAEAARLANVPDRGRVLADGPIVAAALTRLARRRPVIYNAHNLESSFRHELTARGARERATMRAFVLANFQESWMVSRADMQAARELCPDARLRYAPNVVDVAAIAPVSPAVQARRALFVASFAYEPNRRGLRFLLEEVFPRVWAELPDARLTLVGTGLGESPSSDPRVEVRGFVENLRNAYAGASCAVVPLLQGGGTPLKLIEALAYGLPVVATTRAAAGLELRDGEHCLIAEGGESFAAALLGVLRDGAPELARRGRELAAERYSIEALSALLAP